MKKTFGIFIVFLSFISPSVFADVQVERVPLDADHSFQAGEKLEIRVEGKEMQIPAIKNLARDKDGNPFYYIAGGLAGSSLPSWFTSWFKGSYCVVYLKKDAPNQDASAVRDIGSAFHAQLEQVEPGHYFGMTVIGDPIFENIWCDAENHIASLRGIFGGIQVYNPNSAPLNFHVR